MASRLTNPAAAYGYQNRPFEKYIEVQLWSDEPVRAFLNSAAGVPD